MLFSRKRSGNSSPEELEASKRDEAIKSLERERQRINLEIEDVLKKYANESGNRSLKKRRRKSDTYPNDWNFRSGD